MAVNGEVEKWVAQLTNIGAKWAAKDAELDQREAKLRAREDACAQREQAPTLIFFRGAI